MQVTNHGAKGIHIRGFMDDISLIVALKWLTSASGISVKPSQREV